MRHAEARPALALVATGALAVAVVSQVGPFWAFLATSVVIQALVVCSVGIVYGRGRLLSLCQLSFAAVGAWTMAWFAVHHPSVPFLVQLLVSALVAIPFGVLVGLPTLRLRGDIVAVLTLAFAVAVSAVLSGAGFPGEDNFTPVLRPTWASGDASYFALATVCFVLVCLVLVVADNGRVGSRWSAVGRSERALASYGRSVARAKLGAFAASAFVAGLSGALLAGQVSNVGAASFSPLGSLVLFALAVMCSAGFPEGAVIAGLLSVGVPELLRRLGLPQDLGGIIFGLGAVQALIAGGGGIASDLRRGLRGLARRRGGASGARLATVVPAAPGPDADSSAPVPSAGAPAHAGSEFSVSGLSVRYDAVVALDDVSLVVPPLTVVALIGPNGAGKSTFVDAVTGFVPVTGAITLADRSLEGVSPVARCDAGIRRTFQSGRTMTDLSIGQYLRLAAGRRALTRERAQGIVDFLGLPPLGSLVGGLDVGARRVVEVAGGLAGEPSLLILDEPAAGLTETESEDLGRRIARIPEEYGASVILIDHDMTFVQRTATWMHVLDFGRLIASGSPAEVLRDEAVSRAYLGEVVS